ncbi:hypothetical protein KDAU_67360 [Dictyobacter aurantiacus]|uniref:GH16 domain-containing protein n=1 Tax=Dictyobacter aurantiacus TaxID=1936993 RepID=A0A401ZR98_9CHLR|nr:hypothetical protein KDAU_67360 [Dictyobacter aurantiacus]
MGLLLLVLISGTLFFGPVLISHASPPSPTSYYHLAFSDDFSGTNTDLEKNWTYRLGKRTFSYADGTTHTSIQQASNVVEGGGLLTINLTKDPTKANTYYAGGVITKQRFRYGYYEVQAKSTAQAGWHPAFWRIHSDGSADSSGNTILTCPTMEIDGFEFNTYSNSLADQNFYEHAADGSCPSIYSVQSGNYTLKDATGTAIDETAWHTYGFTYNESGMSFYVDNVLQKTLSSQALSASYRTDCTISSLVSTNPNAGSCPPIQDFTQVWLSCIQYGQTVGTTPTSIQFRNFKYYQKDYYVDNDSASSDFGPSDGTYSETGVWTTSSLAGFGESSSRYSNTNNATANWKLTLPSGTTGSYDVYLYIVANSNNDTAGKVQFNHGGTIEPTQTINFAATPGGWLKIGTYNLLGGEVESVTLTQTNSYARADSIKLVRVG